MLSGGGGGDNDDHDDIDDDGGDDDKGDGNDRDDKIKRKSCSECRETIDHVLDGGCNEKIRKLKLTTLRTLLKKCLVQSVTWNGTSSSGPDCEM